MQKQSQEAGQGAGQTADFDLNGDRLREECGVFGIFGHPDAAAITALGLHALQHRGQEAAGIVSFDSQPFSLRTPARPRRRHLLPPRGDRPPARHRGHRPCALFDHRRDHPAQRAAAVRGAGRRRLRHRPQRQPHQRHRAAPATDPRRRHDAVDQRHRGDPAPGGARQPQPFRRPFHRGPAPARRCLRLCRADQQEAGGRARPARHPPAGDRHARRLPDPGLGDLRARHHRRAIRARRRERRSGHLRRGRHAVAQAVPAAGGAAVHLRIHLFRAAGFDRRRPPGLRRAQGHGRPARARGAGRRRRGAAGAGFRRAGGARLRASRPACPTSSASSATITSAAPSSSRRRRSAIRACA